MGKAKGKRRLRHAPLALDIRPRRKALHLTQEELGELCRVSPATIGRSENGKQNWTQEFLQEVAVQLRCHWWELLPLEAERAKVRELIKLAS